MVIGGIQGRTTSCIADSKRVPSARVHVGGCGEYSETKITKYLRDHVNMVLFFFNRNC